MIGSIGGAEFFLIAVLALLLFGPRKLPQIGRSVGKAMAEFRGAANEFKSSLEREVEMDQINEVREGVTSAQREVTQALREATDLGVPRRPIRETADEDVSAADTATTTPPDGDTRKDS